jgi:energy-coupling factor transporter ATP-binding protein EcfA2
MRLTKLEILRLPGLVAPLVLDDLDGGSNLVVGPNGSGKSSLVRALTWLLADGGQGPVDLDLCASFRREKSAWTVTRRGRDVEWTCDGRKVARPPFPAGEELRHYRLDLQSLLAADDEELLFGELRRILRGGYDLDALRGGGGSPLGPRWGQKEARALGEAQRNLRQVQRERGELERALADLPKLRQRYGAARKALAEAEELQRALSLLGCRRERLEAEAHLASFPAAMARLSGDEARRLEALDGERERLAREREVLRVRLDEARRLLREKGFGEEGLDRGRLDRAARELDQVCRLDDRIGSRERERDALARAEADSLRALGGRGPADLRPLPVSRAEELASRIHALQEELRSGRARLAQNPEPPDETLLEASFEAVEALREWLAIDGRGRRRLALPLVVALAGLLPLLARLRGEGALLPFLGASLAGLFWALGETFRDGRRQARQRFETFQDPLPRWDHETVRRSLKAAEAERARLLGRREAALAASELRSGLARAEAELARLEEERVALACSVGFDPGLTVQGFDLFVRLADEHRRLRSERREADGDCRSLRADRARRWAEIEALIGRWAGPEGLASTAAAASALEELRRRVDSVGEAQASVDSLGEALSRLAERLSLLDAEEKALFDGAGLEGRTELLACLSRLESWRSRREDLVGARSREEFLRQSLKSRPDLLARVDDGDGAGLERDRAEREEAGQAWSSLGERIGRIEERLEAARREGRLEEAAASVDEARSQLEEKRLAFFRALLAERLLDDVEAAFVQEREPELLRRGRDLFGRFTRHAFELAVDPSRGFLVRDRAAEEDRTVSELSSATRMQLLLALRLAWIGRVEEGRLPLPLFLDEALTNSDEDRFGQVVLCLEELARQGRQVLYLSSRPYEELLWEEATGRRPRRIDLAPGAWRGESPPGRHRVDIPSVPSPEGHDAESYGRLLGVPSLDPRRPGGIHLFHLLRDDLDLLRFLLAELRLSTMGALELLLAGPQAPRLLEPSRSARLALRTKIARAWCEAWLRGRGRLVDGAVLEGSGAVSGRFLNPASALARSVGGDGRALVAALREGALRHFRSEAIDQLEARLRAEGYIDEREDLDEEGRRQAVASVVSADPRELHAVIDGLEAGTALIEVPKGLHSNP